MNENGLYLQKIPLPEGHILCRYGHEGGRFTTDTGTPYSMLGLPYKPETLEYHEYIVINKLEVCIIKGVFIQCLTVQVVLRSICIVRLYGKKSGIKRLRRISHG